MLRDIVKKIEDLKRKLYAEIDVTGLNSNKTKVLSEEIDNEINKYYNVQTEMYKNYIKSIFHLKKITQAFGDFPTTREWNKYAKENMLLSNVTIEYISGLNWNKLRKKIKAEIK